MPVITLPDRSTRRFECAVTVADVAMDIGPKLADAALAGIINEHHYVDTDYLLDKDVSLKIVTAKDKEGLDILRHSCAHLMAQAVKQLFPDVQITIGPVIENGFYYDFAYPRSFNPEDLEKIELRMKEIAMDCIRVNRSVMARDQAVAFFANLGEHYKAEIISEIPKEEAISLYSQGDFIDLCRGPHVPHTGHLKHFKLMKVAGAYWRGNAENEMLQRIYGTCWASKRELKAYLYQLEEAEKRDHRKLAKSLDLFHMQAEAPGMVFWHDKGWKIYLLVQDYIRDLLRQHDYLEVHTPQIVDQKLWEKSGHWDKFGDMIFATSSEHRNYAIKPMNCPCHVQIYNQTLNSYRDLPMRMAEFGSCHRNEPSGTLHGLMRVRNFVQDDAHIFCTEEQIQSEVTAFIDLVFSVYRDFGFTDIKIALSTRPQQRVGSDEMWDKSEQALQVALENCDLSFTVQPGEGAFYGPKIEFILRDCLGRLWQCGTVQVDFSMPERLGATYIAEDGSRQIPVMLHRAVLGSLERFIGILIEEYEGKFPVWLAPIQAVVMNITDKQAKFAKEIKETLINRGIRAEFDLRNEKIGFKIRTHTLLRVPYLLVIGNKEVESRLVSVRTRSGVDLGTIEIDAFIALLEQDIAKRRTV